MARRTLVITLFAVMSLVVSAATAGASNAWNDFHWDDAADGQDDSVVALTLRSHLSGDWQSLLEPVRADWDAAQYITLGSQTLAPDPSACETTTPPPAATPYIDVCNGAYGLNGWLGLASIWIASDHHILAGFVKVNDSYFDTATYDDQVARRHVLCQEVGHTIGLDHLKGRKNRSCMNDQFGLFSASFQSPSKHDRSTVESIYCHIDPTCNGDSGGGKGKGNGNGKKPKNMSVRSLPNGVTQITWIVPVPSTP